MHVCLHLSNYFKTLTKALKHGRIEDVEARLQPGSFLIYRLYYRNLSNTILTLHMRFHSLIRMLQLMGNKTTYLSQACTRAEKNTLCQNYIKPRVDLEIALNMSSGTHNVSQWTKKQTTSKQWKYMNEWKQQIYLQPGIA